MSFEWPVQLASLATQFSGYTWGLSSSLGKPQVFGICPLEFRWPNSLATVEGRIYTPSKGGDGSPTIVGDNIDYYLILELLGGSTARANLAVLVENREWYLLDEHVLSIKHIYP